MPAFCALHTSHRLVLLSHLGWDFFGCLHFFFYAPFPTLHMQHRPHASLACQLPAFYHAYVCKPQTHGPFPKPFPHLPKHACSSEPPTPRRTGCGWMEGLGRCGRWDADGFGIVEWKEGRTLDVVTFRYSLRLHTPQNKGNFQPGGGGRTGRIPLQAAFTVQQ